MHIQTTRLNLRPWQPEDLDNFYLLHADDQVMADQGGVLTRPEAQTKFERYQLALSQFGYGRLLVETPRGEFLGYCGVMPVRRAHPLGEHAEIGWRLRTQAWGQGFAPEAALAVLQHTFTHSDLTLIYAYTTSTNLNSQRVMEKLHLARDATLDFDAEDARLGLWRGWVWSAHAEGFKHPQGN